MKKFLVIAFSVILIGSFSTSSAHAFTLDDLMGQIASLRAEVSQLRGSLGAQVISAIDGVVSTDSTKPVTSATTTQTSLVAPTSNFYYVMLEGSTECIAVKVLPTKSYTSCIPNESLNTIKPVVSKTLYYGQAKSVDILNLQTYLKAKRLLSATPNGIFGPATRAAVIALQRSNGLPLTGVVDVKTRSIINGTSMSTIAVPTTGASTDSKIDAYIKNIPNQIAQLQSIQKDPTILRKQVVASTPKVAPQESQNLVGGYWKLMWWFEDSDCSDVTPPPGYIATHNTVLNWCMLYWWVEGGTTSS